MSKLSSLHLVLEVTRLGSTADRLHAAKIGGARLSRHEDRIDRQEKRMDEYKADMRDHNATMAEQQRLNGDAMKMMTSLINVQLGQGAGARKRGRGEDGGETQPRKRLVQGRKGKVVSEEMRITAEV